MKRTLLAIAACTLALPALAQDNPFSQFKGKIKEGNWEYKVQMEGAGLPAGAGAMTFNHCITPQDVEGGGFTSKGGKMPDGCTVKNMKMAGNSATYTMECTKQPKMTSDVAITFGGDNFTMKQKMAMDAGGQVMNINQSMTGRLTGPCTAPKK